MKNYINGKEVTPFEAVEHEALSAVLANTITFLSVIFTIGFFLFALYAVSKAKSSQITFEDIKSSHTEYKWQIEHVDLDALSKAVSRHETNRCNAPGNFTAVNNCHGIRVYNGERLVPAQFPGYINGQYFANSYDAFIDLWERKYGGIPTWEQAVAYSGNDRANIWHRNVLAFYDEYSKKLKF